jgi:ATP-binding cassette, subfamily F, member 3
LKRALQNYEGTFIVVSHDREFLDGLTNRIWDIQDKTLKIHHYDVKEYLQKKMSVPATEITVKDEKNIQQTQVEEQKPVEKTLSFEEQKELKRKKNALQNAVKKAEEKIATLEQKIVAMDQIVEKSRL